MIDTTVRLSTAVLAALASRLRHEADRLAEK